MVSSAQVQNRNRKYEFATYAQSHTPSTTQASLTTLRLPNGWSQMIVSNARRFQWRIQQRCRVDKAIAVVSQFCCGIVWPSQSTCSFLSHLEIVKPYPKMPDANSIECWSKWTFLCSVPFFCVKSSIKLGICWGSCSPLRLWAKQPQLSKNETNWMGILVWAWATILNLLASSLGWSSKKSKLFSKAAL